MSGSEAKFRPGQLIQHKLFEYRGVVLDVDPTFQGTEEWYETMARSQPPKDRPWYHVLVHNATHTTYVAERNLEPDEAGTPVNHPLVPVVFNRFENGVYLARRKSN